MTSEGLDPGIDRIAGFALPKSTVRLPRAGRWMAVMLVLAALAGAVVAAGRIGANQARGELRDRALAALPLATGTLVGEVEKQRLIPQVLARDDAVRQVLRQPTKSTLAALDQKLLEIARDASASAVYVIDADGIAIAASNAGEPTTFVGSDYRFRHYFVEAMAKSAASQYALGTVSGRPGLYLSNRVDDHDRPLGVVVLKVELDRVENSWRQSGFVVFATDKRGVVLATSLAEWRFRTLSPLSASDAAAAREQLQLPEARFDPLPLSRGTGDDVVLADGSSEPRRFVEVAQDLADAMPAWRLSLLMPADAALNSAAMTARLTTLLALLLAGMLVVVFVRRRRALRQRQETLSRMNAELEDRVGVRTAELSRSNAALAGEIAERESAEAKVRRLRDELAQANRLSILGQITAGVAHEINQPLAAIRTYAENAGRFLDGDKVMQASSNLTSIVAMTERIGTITDTLRSFARRASQAASPLPAREAVDGALSLLSGRIRDSGVTIVGPPSDSAQLVMASRIRLEQILVNLLQNALDALKDQPDPRIEIEIAETGEMVAITVRDNGPGLPPGMRDNLFMPFQTSKEKGLGLGLVISEEIARELGGSLRFDPTSARGASFTVELKRATE